MGSVGRIAMVGMAFSVVAACAVLEPSPERMARVLALVWQDQIKAGGEAYDRRDFGNAIDRFNKALAFAEQRKRYTGPPEADLMIAISLKNLGAAHSEQCKYADAEPYYKRALAIRESVLDSDHPNVADILNDLATDYRWQGRQDEALPLYERAIRIYEKAGQEPKLVMALNNLGHVYEAQGRFLDAESVFRNALNTIEKAIGPNPKRDHPSLPGLISTLRGYASSVRKAGRISEADELENRVVYLGRQMNEYTASLRKSGRAVEAEMVEAQVQRIMGGALGATAPCSPANR